MNIKKAILLFFVFWQVHIFSSAPPTHAQDCTYLGGFLLCLGTVDYVFSGGYGVAALAGAAHCGAGATALLTGCAATDQENEAGGNPTEPAQIRWRRGQEIN